MNSTEGYPAPRAIAAAIGRCGDAGYRHSVEILPTVRRCKQRSIAQLAMKLDGRAKYVSFAEESLRVFKLRPFHFSKCENLSVETGAGKHWKTAFFPSTA